jgi:hypothetical protein
MEKLNKFIGRRGAQQLLAHRQILVLYPAATTCLCYGRLTRILYINSLTGSSDPTSWAEEPIPTAQVNETERRESDSVAPRRSIFYCSAENQLVVIPDVRLI